MVQSLLPEAKYLPSVENSTQFTMPVCPRRVISSLCLQTLQILTDISQLLEAKYLPSSEKTI